MNIRWTLRNLKFCRSGKCSWKTKQKNPHSLPATLTLFLASKGCSCPSPHVLLLSLSLIFFYLHLLILFIYLFFHLFLLVGPALLMVLCCPACREDSYMQMWGSEKCRVSLFSSNWIEYGSEAKPGSLEGSSITDIWETICCPFEAQKFWRLRSHGGRPSLLHSGVLTANVLEGGCRFSSGMSQKGSLSAAPVSILSQVIISKDYLCASIFE